jgi:hypothetical protein
MPWLDGEPPRDGKSYVCETPSHDGPLFLRWFKYNGLEAWRDWDADPYTDVKRWHPLEGEIEDADLHKAVETIKAFMRREFIVEECRKAPCFGCASCEAVALERRLDALLGVI